MAGKTHSVKFIEPGCIAWFWNYKNKQVESCTVIDLFDDDKEMYVKILTKEGTTRRLRKLRLYKHKDGVSKHWGTALERFEEELFNGEPDLGLDQFVVNSLTTESGVVNVSVTMKPNFPTNFINCDFEMKMKEDNND